MIPFGSKTITLIHRAAAGWECSAIDGCSLRSIRRRSISGQAAETGSESVCRIPAGTVIPAAGDVIIPGRHDATVSSEIELVRLLDANRRIGAFRVESVADNAAASVIPHYAARGA